MLRGLGQVPCLGLFLFGREMRPEEGDEVRAVRALEGARDAGRVVQVGGHHLGAQGRELTPLGRSGVARDGTDRKRTVAIRQDRAREAAALRAGRTHDGNDFLGGSHVEPPFGTAAGGRAVQESVLHCFLRKSAAVRPPLARCPPV
jgi:hypothetical protein